MKNIISRSLFTAILILTGLFGQTAYALDSFSDSYRNGFWSSASISGLEPSEAGSYPVFLYMVGTTENYQNGAAQAAVEGMAQRGYVAATVQYSNTFFGSCSNISGKAEYIFEQSNSNSAVNKICARGKADCSKGIVVGGFSQGAVIAALAKNFDSRVEAAYGMGLGVQYSFYDLRSCLADGNRVLPSERLRAVNGEADDFMGQNASSVRSQLEQLTGLSGGSSAYSVTTANGSGWYMVSHGEVEDGYADHCYMRQGGCLASQSGSNLDPAWTIDTAPWQLNFNLDWLTNFTQ